MTVTTGSSGAHPTMPTPRSRNDCTPICCSTAASRRACSLVRLVMRSRARVRRGLERLRNQNRYRVAATPDLGDKCDHQRIPKRRHRNDNGVVWNRRHRGRPIHAPARFGCVAHRDQMISNLEQLIAAQLRRQPLHRVADHQEALPGRAWRGDRGSRPWQHLPSAVG